MPIPFFSAYYRNGEDILFYDAAFQELAESIVFGQHSFRIEYSTLGWHYFYSTPDYTLEVVHEYGGGGYGKIKATPPNFS